MVSLLHSKWFLPWETDDNKGITADGDREHGTLLKHGLHAKKVVRYHNTECLIGSTKVAPKFLFLITKYYYSSRSILEAQQIVYLKKGV